MKYFSKFKIYVFIGCLFCLSNIVFGEEWPPDISIIEISFNYDSGSTTYDAVTLKANAYTYKPVPKWKQGVRNHKVAYIQNQTNRKIKTKFQLDRSGDYIMGVYANEYQANYGIGDVNETEVSFDGSDKLIPKVMTCDGTIPSGVRKNYRYNYWHWYVTYICEDDVEPEEFETPIYIGITGPHNYYTLYDDPKSPNTAPRVDILDYACQWADGSSSAGNVCGDILNGFSNHYTWYYNCHYLSSNFVHLVSSLGISASQHKWAAKDDPGYYDMEAQKTKSIDPVGNQGQGVYYFVFHQWAEAASSLRDPTTALSPSGDWGDYEDDLFTDYRKGSGQWDYNHSGQSYGCEAPSRRIYNANPAVKPFTNPDR